MQNEDSTYTLAGSFPTIFGGIWNKHEQTQSQATKLAEIDKLYTRDTL
jgi:hypothetical protein